MNPDFSDLLLHEQTKAQVRAFFSRPAQTLLITGAAGSGKASLAKTIAARLLNVKHEQLDSYPKFIKLLPPLDKQEIPIDSVRQLIKDLRLKSPGEEIIRRLVLIENANTLSLEAQNALLKILEEPANDVAFILTAPSKQSLLPTIVSRSQYIHNQPVSLEESLQFYQPQKKLPAVKNAWLLSGGNPGLMTALLFDESPHPLKQAVDETKAWLKCDGYQRQLTLEQLTQNKIQTALFLEALSRILRALQHQYIASNQLGQVRRITGSRMTVARVQRALEANASPKLAHQHLLLNLKV